MLTRCDCTSKALSLPFAQDLCSNAALRFDEITTAVSSLEETGEEVDRACYDFTDTVSLEMETCRDSLLDHMSETTEMASKFLVKGLAIRDLPTGLYVYM